MIFEGVKEEPFTVSVKVKMIMPTSRSSVNDVSSGSEVSGTTVETARAAVVLTGAAGFIKKSKTTPSSIATYVLLTDVPISSFRRINCMSAAFKLITIVWLSAEAVANPPDNLMVTVLFVAFLSLCMVRRAILNVLGLTVSEKVTLSWWLLRSRTANVSTGAAWSGINMAA